MRLVFIFILFLKFNWSQSQNITCLYELTYKTKVSDSFTKSENYYLDISDLQSVFRSEKDKNVDSLNQKNRQWIIKLFEFQPIIYSKRFK